MNAYAYAYVFAEIEGTLTFTLMSTAKNGEYSVYASASAYDYAITGLFVHLSLHLDEVESVNRRPRDIKQGRIHGYPSRVWVGRGSI